MPRTRVELPDTFPFHTELLVRVDDINYGGHMGNDRFLAFLHEARVQFLDQFGCSERDVGGCGLILSRLEVDYVAQAFHGDRLRCELGATNLGGAGFDLVYRVARVETEVLRARSVMVCFNYETQRVCRMPETLKQKLTS